MGLDRVPAFVSINQSPSNQHINET